MKPIEFPEQNCIYAKDQPEYLPLPAHRTKDGIVISCWELTNEECIKVLNERKIWISVLTYNAPIQPILPVVNTPFIGDHDVQDKAQG